MNLTKPTNSLINNIMVASKQVDPVVGMGATMVYWTDRVACTIIAVKGKRVTVQVDHSTRTDQNGLSDAQSYEYAPDPNGATYTFSLRKTGKYVRVGDSLKGQHLVIGFRQQYVDPCF